MNTPITPPPTQVGEGLKAIITALLGKLPFVGQLVDLADVAATTLAESERRLAEVHRVSLAVWGQWLPTLEGDGNAHRRYQQLGSERLVRQSAADVKDSSVRLRVKVGELRDALRRYQEAHRKAQAAEDEAMAKFVAAMEHWSNDVDRRAAQLGVRGFGALNQ